jgi:hypothetical protein
VRPPLQRLCPAADIRVVEPKPVSKSLDRKKPYGISALQERLFRADPDADEGRWIAETRERRPKRPASRDRRSAWPCAYGLFAVLSAVLIHSQQDFSPFVAVTITAAFALAATVEFEVGAGSAVPTQLILVPMLFAMPLGLVPVCVLAGLVLADAPKYVRREAHLERAALLAMSAWYCAGPMIVLAALGATEPRLSDWPIYVLALLCQFAIDFAVSTSRSWYAFGTPPASQLGQMASAWTMDAALAPVGLYVALVGVHHPYAFLACEPLILQIAVFRTRAAHPHRQRARARRRV